MALPSFGRCSMAVPVRGAWEVDLKEDRVRQLDIVDGSAIAVTAGPAGIVTIQMAVE